MAYSEVGIVNLALVGHLGALPISSLTESSPNAIRANVMWEYIRDEVLSARDWKFAITRTSIPLNSTSPQYAYDYAYTLPSDYLRTKRWTNKGSKFYSSWYWNPWLPYHTLATQVMYDPPVYPPGYPYVIEALPSSSVLCLMTDYESDTDNPLYITYLRRETNPLRYTPSFIAALAARLAAGLAISITESRAKMSDCMAVYQRQLVSAESLNESYDFIEDETGSNEWEDAGR